MRVWRNNTGDLLTLREDARGPLPDYADKWAVESLARHVAESNKAGLVDVKSVLREGQPGASFIYKRFEDPGYIFGGMLILWKRRRSYTWMMMAREEGPKRGARESTIRAELIESGAVTPAQYVDRSESDPENSVFRGVLQQSLASVADDEMYDSRFPDHPLSRMRKVLDTLPFPSHVEPQWKTVVSRVSRPVGIAAYILVGLAILNAVGLEMPASGIVVSASLLLWRLRRYRP